MSDPKQALILPPAPNLPAQGYYVHNPFAPPQPEFEPEAQGVPLSHYLWILRRHWWKIAAFVITCVIATFIISSRLTPIYQSTATIDIDRQAPSAIIGQDSNRNIANDSDQFLATQVKLIQS